MQRRKPRFDDDEPRPLRNRHQPVEFDYLLVHNGRLVVIDLPQVVDVIANPLGPSYLDHDATNVAGWFAARGVHAPNPPDLAALLRTEAGFG